MQNADPHHKIIKGSPLADPHHKIIKGSLLADITIENIKQTLIITKITNVIFKIHKIQESTIIVKKKTLDFVQKRAKNVKQLLKVKKRLNRTSPFSLPHLFLFSPKTHAETNKSEDRKELVALSTNNSVPC